MLIRAAQLDDLEAIFEIESLDFTLEEAASKETLSKRIQNFSSHFLVLEQEGTILGYVNGACCFQRNLEDWMYSMEQEEKDANHFMVFGLAVHPDFQRKGYGTLLMNELQNRLRQESVEEIVLTCKASRIPFYRALGFVDEGISSSTHGNVIWHQMRKHV